VKKREKIQDNEQNTPRGQSDEGEEGPVLDWSPEVFFGDRIGNACKEQTLAPQAIKPD